MSSERPEASSSDPGSSNEAAHHQATVIVRGETVSDQAPNSPPKDASRADQEKPPTKKVSEVKIKLQSRLPALDDDSDVGVPKQQRVTRDGKADLSFTGTLLASAAPTSAPTGKWQEYRIYETNGGKHVFSKVSRSDPQKIHSIRLSCRSGMIVETVASHSICSLANLCLSRPSSGR
jgi:hypothetical protein